MSITLNIDLIPPNTEISDNREECSAHASQTEQKSMSEKQTKTDKVENSKI